MSESEKACLVGIVIGVIALVLLFAYLIWLEKLKKADPKRYAKHMGNLGGKSSVTLSPERKVVVKTRILDITHTATSKLDTGSAVGRAVVGSFLAGPTGAMVGAMSGHQTVKERHTTTFLLYCEDGSKEAETVKNDSAKYKKYIALLED